jgi:hypothetical protein
MTLNTYSNTLAAQRMRQPLAEAKPKASRLHAVLGGDKGRCSDEYSG